MWDRTSEIGPVVAGGWIQQGLDARESFTRRCPVFGVNRVWTSLLPGLPRLRRSCAMLFWRYLLCSPGFRVLSSCRLVW